MAKRIILQSPDPILFKKCRPVEAFDEKLAILLDDMRETLEAADGAGLAAPQVGVDARAVVIDVEEGFFELVNPEIYYVKGEQTGPEGCLSVTNIAELLNYSSIYAFSKAFKEKYGVSPKRYQ